MSNTNERFVTFKSGGVELSGIVHEADSDLDVALIMLVGGPQYRVGSHRMYVKMARYFAAKGIRVLRFDFSGIGDSGGEFLGFEDVDQDIRSACDYALKHFVSAKRLILFGLCDGASAAAMYAQTDGRVAGLALLNPWVHTEQGEAKAFVWYYYPRRLLQRDFWRSLFSGQVNVGKSILDLGRKLALSLPKLSRSANQVQHFIARMRASLAQSDKALLFLLSDNDLTAAEFSDLLEKEPNWKSVRSSANKVILDDADHTLSRRPALIGACREICTFVTAVSDRVSDEKPNQRRES